jgi:hypothetical protein
MLTPLPIGPTVTEPTQTKETEERPEQRLCISARHHSDSAHVDTKEEKRDQTKVLAYRPPTTVTELTPTKGIEGRPYQRTCLLAPQHCD